MCGLCGHPHTGARPREWQRVARIKRGCITCVGVPAHPAQPAQRSNGAGLRLCGHLTRRPHSRIAPAHARTVFIFCSS